MRHALVSRIVAAYNAQRQMTAPKGQQGILVVVDDPGWRKIRGLLPRLKRAAAARRKAARFRGAASLTILLSSDTKLKASTGNFAARTSPPMSCPFPPRRTGRLSRRHRAGLWRDAPRSRSGGQEPCRSCHAIWWCMASCIWPAMITIRARDAKVMETLEIEILGRLGIADPYEAAAMSDTSAGPSAASQAPDAAPARRRRRPAPRCAKAWKR